MHYLTKIFLGLSACDPHIFALIVKFYRTDRCKKILTFNARLLLIISLQKLGIMCQIVAPKICAGGWDIRPLCPPPPTPMVHESEKEGEVPKF